MSDFIKIKPLEWVMQKSGYWVSHNHPIQPCWIKLYVGTDKYSVYADGLRGAGNNFDTLDEAMDAVKQHYERRILATIDAQATREAVLEKAIEICEHGAKGWLEDGLQVYASAEWCAGAIRALAEKEEEG